MAEEEEKNDKTEADAPEVETASEATASEAPDDAPTPEPDSASDEKSEPEPETPAAEPAQAIAPKERKQRAKAAKAASTPARQTLTPEERHAERVAERGRKAAVRRTGRQRARTKERAGRAGAETTPPREHPPRVQKTRQGVVVSDRADKTITVRIDIARRHRRYSKIVRTSNTLHAHDERNDAHIGDTVIVRESRPLSRLKRWRLVEVIERAK